MSVACVPVVYLDSQDYSNFGDALRGKGDPSIGPIFDELERRKLEGKVRFAISMPVVGELFQYSPDYRETTFKKAEAVQRLCDGYALSYPSRLVAAEIAQKLNGSHPHILSNDWYWYPNISEVFDDLDRQMSEMFEKKLAGIQVPNRKFRKHLTRQARKIGVAPFVREVAPAVAAEYGLPESAISGSIAAKLEGIATSEQASRMLFGTIAEPSKFVETYFERLENDRSLPRWMSDMGRSLGGAFEQMREDLRPSFASKQNRDLFGEALTERTKSFGAAVLALAKDDLREFNVSEVAYQSLSGDAETAWEIPVCRTAGLLIEAYVKQVLGYFGNEPKVEHSFAGDLVHAFYLSHVDLWRGDRRFAALVKTVIPDLAHRVVSTLKELPSAIDGLQELSHC